MYQLSLIFKILEADKLLCSVILSGGTRLHINSEDMEDMSEYQRAMATGFMFDNLLSAVCLVFKQEQEMGATVGNT